jgi:hypothetical protein
LKKKLNLTIEKIKKMEEVSENNGKILKLKKIEKNKKSNRVGGE